MPNLAAGDVGQSRISRIANPEAGSRHGMPRHEVLRKCLARFERRRSRRWADDRSMVGSEYIHDAAAERNFRTDDGQIDLLALRDGEEIVRFTGISRDA